MTLRLVFGREDLQRVRLADDVDLMWELILSLQLAQEVRVPVPFMAWRQRLGWFATAVADSRWRATTPLRSLVAAAGDFPDFLTPHQSVTDLDTACELLSSVSPARVGADVAAAFTHRGPTSWTRSLMRADRSALLELVGGVRATHHLLLEPVWMQVRERVATERARRANVLSTQGVGALLAGLPGVLGWDGAVLRTRYPEMRTVQLNGRGIILVPSYFCWGNPITWIDPALPPVLVYQAWQRGDLAHDVDVPPAVVSLLGRTRAECLRALLEARSTSDLAQLLGTSVGTASKQATVLREAGLITSTRTGSSVLHATTALGRALLVGALPCS
ncbi:MAG TPA: winged helix-turn-helix domain-containing protein [Actinophytocola sp.]|uniref:winged helix-turn-helix domain-containing protein n=1 Tax=Actinophytocola sp. TaxID=1872138 RepID=UPI002DBAC621|nr:winged helix-turn-helix domain-containing protein [Actinophytocola sp.]HEU5470697.1 winged helix-turn-helix domain-containing protein [Actinophytocola sp.]